MKEEKMREKKIIGSLVWMGIKGPQLLEEEKTLIERERISGVVLFTRNIQSLEQVFGLCQQIHALKPRPLIAVDREGGEVDRLKHLPDFPAWPRPTDIARACSLEEIEQTAFYMARDLRALGVDINFAPSVDVPVVPTPLLKGRTWGADPAEVTAKARAYMKGFKRAGIIGCAKHFPGHGGVKEDSHSTLPVDNQTYKQLSWSALVPFRDLARADCPMIMTAHILYPRVDPAQPATLSARFLQDILRKKIGFKGLIVTDDLDMKALHTKDLLLPELMAQSLKAGADILLKCEWMQNTTKVLEHTLRAFKKAGGEEKDLLARRARLERLRKNLPAGAMAHSLVKLKNALDHPPARRWYDTLIAKTTGQKSQTV